MREEPTLDDALKAIREASRTDLDGVGEVSRDEPSISPGLAPKSESK